MFAFKYCRLSRQVNATADADRPGDNHSYLVNQVTSTANHTMGKYNFQKSLH